MRDPHPLHLKADENAAIFQTMESVYGREKRFFWPPERWFDQDKR